MSAAPSHSNPAQNRTSTQSRQIPTVATSTSANKDDVIQHQRDEIARLQAQLAQLVTSQASIPQANQHGATPSQAGIGSTSGSPNAPVQQANPQQALFLDEAAAEQARAQLIAKATEDSPPKKAALPDIVPGFKASPLSLGKFLLPSSVVLVFHPGILLPMGHLYPNLPLPWSVLLCSFVRLSPKLEARCSLSEREAHYLSELEAFQQS
jgi:hypothetical protein